MEYDTEEEADRCTHEGGRQRIGDTLREIADAEERAHGVSPYAPQNQGAQAVQSRAQDSGRASSQVLAILESLRATRN
jgi:hypothetical protein